MRGKLEALTKRLWSLHLNQNSGLSLWMGNDNMTR